MTPGEEELAALSARSATAREASPSSCASLPLFLLLCDRLLHRKLLERSLALLCC